jgi:hypothetical protein
MVCPDGPLAALAILRDQIAALVHRSYDRDGFIGTSSFHAKKAEAVLRSATPATVIFRRA